VSSRRTARTPSRSALFAQQVDQGDIWDDAAGAAIVTAER
jgi:hypothetical protein